QEAISVHLHLYEGITPPLIMSAIAIGLGLVIFFWRKPIIATLNKYPEGNPAVLYEWLFFTALPDVAKWVTSHLQNGRLRYYMTIIIMAFVASVAGVMLVTDIIIFPDNLFEDFDPLITSFALLLII